MGRFLQVAYKVLAEAGQPLSAKEIAEIGVEKRWLVTAGKTPWQTMKSKLSTDILLKKRSSLFMRTEQGKFALREWANWDYKEYVAERFKRALLNEDILVFPKESIWRYIPGPGLHTMAIPRSRELLGECRLMPRRLAEENFTVIQLVSVFIVRYGNRYLTYKRTRRLPESRLHGYYSLIFGGHLNSHDAAPLWNILEPEFGAHMLMRELSEELVLPKTPRPSVRYVGVLYDTSRELSSQHLGIVYNVLLRKNQYQIGERGFLIDAKLETLSQIEARLSQFENWSVVLFEYLRSLSKVTRADGG